MILKSLKFKAKFIVRRRSSPLLPRVGAGAEADSGTSRLPEPTKKVSVSQHWLLRAVLKGYAD